MVTHTATQRKSHKQRLVALIQALMTLLAVTELPALSHAYNKDNVLVDYGDLIKISMDQDYAEVQKKMELYSFPYIE